jgi:hypothetical protein
MFSSVPTGYLESMNKTTELSPVENRIVETKTKRPKSTVTKMGAIKRVREFSDKEKNDLLLLLINKNRANTELNLKSQNYKVLIANEHVDSEICQIL